MTKELKDFLQFYIGCEMYSVPQQGEYFIEKLTGVDIDCIRIEGNLEYPPYEHKPILRRLSDMTEEEAIECGNLDYDFSGEPDLNKWTWKDFDTLNSSSQFQYLLSKHFDLFGLIDEGLAVDKATLK